MTENVRELPPLEERPLVTFALFAYNQEKYIREAVAGAFAQTYEPLEIILSDDCSTDRTFEIMKEMAEQYQGHHKIILNKNKENFGLIKHVNFINSLSKGALIVAAAGDDISLPHRTSVHAKTFFENEDNAFAIHSSVNKIDDRGNKLGIWKPPILSTNSTPKEIYNKYGLVVGASQSWSRRIDNIFGPIKYESCYEDMVISFRASLLGGIFYIDEPLVLYRYGVGISDNQRAIFGSAKEKINKITNFNITCLAVAKQRLLDLQAIQMTELAFLLRSQIVLLVAKVWLLRVFNIFPEAVLTKILRAIEIKRSIRTNFK